MTLFLGTKAYICASDIGSVITKLRGPITFEHRVGLNSTSEAQACLVPPLDQEFNVKHFCLFRN